MQHPSSRRLLPAVRRSLEVVLSMALGFVLILATVPAGATSRSTASLNRLADDYYWSLQGRIIRPKISPKANAAWVKKLDTYERRLGHIKTSKLGGQARITFSMLKNELRQQREYITQGWIKGDINGTEGMMQSVVDGLDAVERKTVRDWSWTLKTLRNSQRFVDNYIPLLAEGLAEGKGQSRDAIRSSIKSLGILSGRGRESPFLALKGELERTMAGKPQLPALRRALDKVLEENVLPAHRKLEKFLERKYLPKAPSLGSNREAYLRAMEKHLGADHATPEALGAWGRSEVAKLRAELTETLREVVPDAKTVEEGMRRLNRRPDQKFKDGDELIAATKAEIKKTEKLARRMAPVPRSKVEVVKVAPHQEATMAAQYTTLGDRDGAMQVNTGKLLAGQHKFGLATLVTHEVYGGHHLAMMYAMRQGNLPEYRKGAAFTTYDEGWALYAEAWRDQSHQFTPVERVGFLVDHLWRAARLVVDTGLHTGTMTRREAIDYFHANTFIAKTNAAAEIERYINIPGQALAYYVGKQQLLDAKAEAKKILGDKFDERAFHHKLLSLSSVPHEEMHKAMVTWAKQRLGQLD
jgi:uncharacterized protein (DUF885 family)